jgi:hypothetical protein
MMPLRSSIFEAGWHEAMKREHRNEGSHVLGNIPLSPLITTNIPIRSYVTERPRRANPTTHVFLTATIPQAIA